MEKDKKKLELKYETENEVIVFFYLIPIFIISIIVTLLSIVVNVWDSPMFIASGFLIFGILLIYYIGVCPLI